MLPEQISEKSIIQGCDGSYIILTVSSVRIWTREKEGEFEWATEGQI